MGSITFESPSPKGQRVTQVTPEQYAGTYTFLAQVTNGRLAPLALVGRLTLYQPPAPIQRPFKLQICRGSTCHDSSGTRSDSFPLIGHTDAAANHWPVYADKPSDTQDSKAPGVEAILTRDSLLEFSLGPGVNAEDGPPRFTITEVTSTGFAGWWYEGAPIVNPSGGYFCLVRAP